MRKIAGYKIHLDKLSALNKVFYNIIASILPSVVLQLLIYPAYSGFVSQKQYGNMITILSILTVIAISVGNALNNVRLLRQNEYFEAGQHGDYLCEAGQGDGLLPAAEKSNQTVDIPQEEVGVFDHRQGAKVEDNAPQHP